MNFIYIEFGEDEHVFENVDEAEEFLMKNREDGNEFFVEWKNEDGDVVADVGLYYTDPAFEDQDAGEFKVSPEAGAGDYDRDAYWISSDEEEGDVYELLAQY